MKFLIVDDHVLIREALRGVLHELKDGATILEASGSREAIQRVSEQRDIDLVTLDLNLPDRDGFELLSQLRELHPAMAIVVLSAHHDRETITRALDLGALGFIPKSAQRHVMLNAFNLVFAGSVYVPPEVLVPVLPALPASIRPGPVVTAAALGLTARQMEVLVLMMRGKSNKAICRTLNIAEPTVKNHVTAILKALKAANRTEAVIAAAARGVEERAST